MRFRKMITVAALAVAIAALCGSAQEERAKLGEPVKDFTLKDLWTDKDLKLLSVKDKATVVIFISYNCDTTWRYEKRIGKLMQEYGAKGVKFVAVRSSARDAVDQTKKYCQQKNFTMPLLYDEKNQMADYFAVSVTPTFFVFDAKGVLRYSGSCDDNPEEVDVTKHYMTDALTALLAGKEVPVSKTRAFG